MFIVHVDLTVNPKSLASIKSIFKETFVDAISAQPGFVAVDLLQSCDDDSSCLLAIAFQDRDLQQKWVATELHQRLWPQIEACCTGHKVRTFHSIQ
ncbi:MAG: antibiotic biosynthesis monooxygenase [Acidobacteria bacterium]|nr:antibiotic biosynthesis monooxygenase [Acidobacteriota bacterium]